MSKALWVPVSAMPRVEPPLNSRSLTPVPTTPPPLEPDGSLSSAWDPSADPVQLPDPPRVPKAGACFPSFLIFKL
jgi:hypothetical protein